MTRSRAYLPLFVLFLTAANAAAQSPDISANELVRKTVEHELAAAEKPAHWMYLSQKMDGTKTVVRQVVQTNEIILERKVAENGAALTTAARAKEDERIARLLSDPYSVQRLKKQQQDDKEKARKMLELLPRAFLYEYAGLEGDLVRLTFKPNPAFTPPTREARVFHSMEGEMWVHADQRRLAKLAGSLTQEVNFGWGLLGHLEKGGRFEVVQSEVAPRIWEMTSLLVDMRGRALIFASINTQERESMSQFERIPDALTAAQAADLLRRKDYLARN